jgi:hypothetical protein
MLTSSPCRSGSFFTSYSPSLQNPVDLWVLSPLRLLFELSTEVSFEFFLEVKIFFS